MSDQEGREDDARYERWADRRAAVLCGDCGGTGGSHDANCPWCEGDTDDDGEPVQGTVAFTREG